MVHPDPDTIKMFAGQIPRRMEEAELRKVFEEFGPVYQINILRDRTTGQSRGCCFVTFFTRKAALEAQNKLHNLRTLPSMHHPMQMKPADAENRSERKLFVGMVGKQADDEAVWAMFEKFGPIEECTVLRDQKNNSKGCAFVTFMSRQNAIAAIRGLHHSRTMEGCSAPLVVKFADSQRDRDARRPPFGPPIGGGSRQAMPNYGNNNWGQQQQQPQMPMQQQQQQQQAPSNMMNPFNPQTLSLLQQLSNAASALSSLAGQAPPSGPPPNMFGMPPPNNGMGQQQGQQQGNFNQQNNPASALAMIMQAAAMTRPAGGPSFQGPPPGNPPNTNNFGSGNFNNNPGTGGGSYGTTGGNYGATGNNYGATGSNYGTPGNNFGTTGNNYGTPGSNFGSFSSPPPFGGGQQSNFPRAQPANSNTPLGRQVEGPDGCNLFIYHLPQQCNDADLANMFSPFGNVISAKVFVDKQTNMSKCFGFVSYDNPASAEAAIQGMNSFMIGSKRLKVQPKRSMKDIAKPY
ncbi:CUGBP Elav-like family member 3-B [Pollicipes pollicipes]|uniref:CUGBP Elav-like family member 3-B n=1 Tax=Pollicipes pollicipes TaxID=41117 RepID=UPI001884C024|nr:CUGBP Elav-like family member 3-B [Pollicipes pollicipes]